MAERDPDTVARAKVLLVDPATMRVLWLNDSAQADLGDKPGAGLPIETAMPLAEKLGAPDALRSTEQDGETRRLRTSLVSTKRGRLDIVCSIYRLPSGELLVLVDTDYVSAPAGRAASGRSR